MELEQLRIFTAVAQSGSFSLGARKLYISHSTTSRAVAALEEELGVRLLERDNHVLGLTKAGEALLEEARRIEDVVRTAVERVRAASEKERESESCENTQI